MLSRVKMEKCNNLFFYEPISMKKGNKQCLFDTPRTFMVIKEIIKELQRKITPIVLAPSP